MNRDELEWEKKIADQEAVLGRIVADPAGRDHDFLIDNRLYQGMHLLIAMQESYIALLKEKLSDCNDSSEWLREFNAPED